MEEISLKDYFSIMRKRSWIIILLTIIPIIAFGIIGFYDTRTEPEYKASTTLIVGGPKAYINDEKQLDYETYKAINGKLMAHYNELIKMEVVIDEVTNNLGLDLTYREFIEKMNIEILDNTEIIKIEVKDKNSDLATKIIDELVAVSSEKANKVMGIENVQAINETRTRAIPVKSKATTNMAISGVLGFVLSIFLVFMLEYFDTVIETPKEIERLLNLPVSGLIPAEEGLVLSEKPGSLASESYRTLRTNIESIKEEKEIKSILVTSSNPDEDKEVVAANIALSMAQIQKKVLFIDGNMRRPEIHTLFGINNDNGLSNVLNGEIDYKEAISRLEKEKSLHILTSGSNFSKPAELLASGNMKNLLEKAKDEYDIIIVNAPSLGAIADSTIISTIVDGTFMVCSSGRTNMDELKLSKKLLDKVNVNIIGVILNKVNLETDYNYKYYYNSYLYYKDRNGK